MPEFDAVVVGAGPNGLTAAVTLARAGRSVLVVEGATRIGGGARTEELTLPGFRHDLGSALYPLGIGSPVLRTLPLERYGLRWIDHEVAVAHPLGPGRVGALHRSLDATVEGLGPDGPVYRRLFEPLVRDWDLIEDGLLGPLPRLPRHPLVLARFGLRAIRPASRLIRSAFATPEARALLAGCAAHSFLPLGRPLTGAFALLYPILAHRFGWPVAAGGAQAIPDALAAYLGDLGGRIETGRWVRSLGDLPSSSVVLLDVSPAGLDGLAGDHLPEGYRRRLRRFRQGPGAYKVDYALDGPVPWAEAALERAGTVHIGGTIEEVEESEADAFAGRPNPRPFLLVAQQSVVDASRAPAGKHTVWAYAHAPNGSRADLTEVVDARIERFAPGFTRRVLARHVIRPTDWESWNPNWVGGDISGGAHTPSQLVFRPFPQPRNPYATPLPGVYLCSASTPPGAGVHGMCGYHAARAALARELR